MPSLPRLAPFAALGLGLGLAAPARAQHPCPGQNALLGTLIGAVPPVFGHTVAGRAF